MLEVFPLFLDIRDDGLPIIFWDILRLVLYHRPYLLIRPRIQFRLLPHQRVYLLNLQQRLLYFNNWLINLQKLLVLHFRLPDIRVALDHVIRAHPVSGQVHHGVLGAWRLVLNESRQTI